MPSTRKQPDNIRYTLKEVGAGAKDPINVGTLLEKFEKDASEAEVPEETYHTDQFLAQFTDYESNYTMKQLVAIHDYYNLGAASKQKKQDVIERIIFFESDEENDAQVTRRQTLWFYLQELKNDPFTKRFVWAA